MWYDQTKGLPDEIVSTAMMEIGPGYDARGVAMEDRAVVIWKGPKGQPDYDTGYLFAAPAALRGEKMNPLTVPVNGKPRFYNVKQAGYIGEPGGYVPPGYPATYRQTPLPNHLHAYILTAVEPSKPAPAPGDLVVRPIFDA